MVCETLYVPFCLGVQVKFLALHFLDRTLYFPSFPWKELEFEINLIVKEYSVHC